MYDGPKRERSLLITFLSPLLFLAPEVHLLEMEELWTDEVIIQPIWNNFMTNLLMEWEGVALWVGIQLRDVIGSLCSRDFIQSTVIITANVGLLAIPGVVLTNILGTNITNASQVVIFTSASQIASSLSIEASIGSLMISLLLVRQKRTKKREDPAGAVSGQSHLMCVP